MNTLTARRLAALISVAGICLTAPAYAQDKTVKIGVLNDMSSLYADIGGANSVVAVKMAVEDSGLTDKGWKIEVQRRPPEQAGRRRQPRAAMDRCRQGRCYRRYAEFRRCAGGLNLVEEKNKVLLNSGARHRRSHRQGLHAEHGLVHL